MTDDKNLSKSDVQSLTTRDGVVAFFAELGYGTDSRQPQSVSAIGITATSLVHQIKHIERVAVNDDGAEPLDVYLVELTSVTVAAIHGLTRALRNRVGNYLLVLTDDYERLDFVLLQRSLPGPSTSPMTTRQVAVRPRILTINRRDPSQVQLRVLRRFTYTEVDSDSQYDKLLSAYTIADWSEPLFNNRALFSDYYLNERLPDLPEWRERPEGVYHRLRELLGGWHRKASQSKSGMASQFVVEPVLEALGFERFDGTGGDSPYYRLYVPENGDKQVAVCLAYPWNRYLDGRDETRDAQNPDENPGARVVSILETGDAPWAIVTNGKVWRLYSSKTHSRSTNYYEIDLDETLAMLDPNEAFRYFWLFFRPNAFVTEEVRKDRQTKNVCFLDRLLEESETYAKGLGERLKERVFERVFPHFAAGFIEHLRGQVGLAGPHQTSLLPAAQQLSLKREPDEDFRRQVFNATLTLLYRLLFLLYAESRDLLPVKEVRGYWEQSLTKLKEEVAQKAGNIEDEVPGRLQESYKASANSTGLYGRLLDLFAVIDKGSRNLNVPLYNGGLFITNPKKDDHSPEGETARFLALHRIPDRYLALGLDLLARDLDDKRQDLVFIDYKSLGVRQLGSIYEGLLEFKVRVAPEKMAVVKGKKTEEVIRYQEAIKSKNKVLTVGRGHNTQERVYQPGDVYLENDRRERKASGSYYTPDHIVRFIVENTLGPVLADKFEKLRPRFREAGLHYGQKLSEADSFRKQGRTPDDPGKIANTYEGLVDDLFDLRVLDPAMGSGHFLVEAVDFICDRILGEREGFLRAFPWNPVTRYLQNTREAIITEMERKGIAVDTGRLTDVNLLKRHVLKRCAYGVDLNPMAVELAKVSLWLDCFTIGAPLSFLDHHLKCGNSLIGTTVQEVEAELATQEKQTLSLFGGPFQGMLAATSSIESLRRIPDATAEQAEQSHTLYASFQDAQAPYKTALDIWVSQHFGNKLAKEYLTLAGADLVDQIRSRGKGLSKQYRDAIASAARIGGENRFFHWDLEFPEAFVDLEGGRWKPNEEQGFDVVVGNPPYDELSEHSAGRALPEKEFIAKQALYSDARGGRLNIFRPFIIRAVSLLTSDGRHSFIVPLGLLGGKFTETLRRRLLNDGILRSISAFPQKDDPRNRVFFEAKLSTCIYVIDNRVLPDEPITVTFYPGRSFEDDSRGYALRLADIADIDSDSMSIPNMSVEDIQRLRIIRACPKVTTWGRVAKCYLGELMTNAKNWHLTSPSPVGPRLLRGANINRYVLLPEPKQGEPLYLKEEEYLREYANDIRVNHHNAPRIGFQESSPIDNWRRLIACVIPAGHFCVHKVRYFTGDASYDLFALLALFNSKMSDWRFGLTSTNNSVNEYEIKALPIPRFDLDETPKQHGDSHNWQSMLEQDTVDSVGKWEAAVLDEVLSTSKETACWPRTIHDALAAGGKELARLREERQSLTQAFTENVFDSLGIDRQKFTGRSHLEGGTADVGERDWTWLVSLLARNKRACRTDPSQNEPELRRLHEEFTTRARSCNSKFKALDEATDRVVWQLVGLTPDGSVP